MKRNAAAAASAAPTSDEDGGSATDTAGAGCGVEGFKRAINKLATPAKRAISASCSSRGTAGGSGSGTPRRINTPGPGTPGTGRSNVRGGNGAPSSALKVCDPVQVFCRVKPKDENTDSCIEVLNDTSLKLFPPQSGNWKQGKATIFACERVFDEVTGQKTVFDVMAKPLLQDLVDGKNSLLFAYGVTGSGKTYTMTGTPDEPGILIRCADILFNSIIKQKAQKNVFIPDKMNGFDVQTKSDAMAYRDRENKAHLANTPGQSSRTRGGTRGRPPLTEVPSSNPNCETVRDKTELKLRDSDSAFAVFVTYVEIYNNFLYDLLDENTKDGKLESKMIRDDASRNTMYVHNVREMEVESPGDLLEVFNRGQKRRRTATTNLNDASSRSHSMFNIRLVQAPLDAQGEEVLDNKNLIHISQLTLVDLAGSERYGRTGATGDRLKEAGGINSSLMILRQCFDALRKSQTSTGEVFIPYKSNKLTTYLKGFFEGQGRIRMILCVNPRADDFDENIHVLSFAEMTKEILIQRDTPAPTPRLEGLTPGRRAAHLLYKEARKQTVDDIPIADGVLPSSDVDMVFHLAPPLPLCRITSLDQVHLITNLRQAMEKRVHAREQVAADNLKRRSEFRNKLTKVDAELDMLRTSNQSLESKFGRASEEINHLKKVISQMQFTTDELRMEKDAKDEQIRQLTEINESLEKRMTEQDVEFQKEKQRMEADLDLQRELDEIKKERQLLAEERRLRAEYKEKDKIIADVKKIMFEADSEKPSSSHGGGRWQSESYASSSEPDFNSILGRSPPVSPSRTPKSKSRSSTRVSSEPRLHRAGLLSPQKNFHFTEDPHSADFGRSSSGFKFSTALVGSNLGNPRRSKASSKNDKWVEHKDPSTVDPGTVFQPKMNKKKSVSHLDKPSDIVGDGNINKYCLRSDICDTDGEIETRLITGNVLPTVSGGAQVVFKEMEILKQVSPTTTTHRDSPSSYFRRKRASHTEIEYNPSELREKCTVGIGSGAGGGTFSKDTVDESPARGRSKRSRASQQD